MRKPTIKTKCVANTYTSQGETIAEVWSPAVKNAHGARGLVIEVYRADPGVFVRINGRDYKLPA